MVPYVRKLLLLDLMVLQLLLLQPTAAAIDGEMCVVEDHVTYQRPARRFQIWSHCRGSKFS
jgi:hypothetical protein